MPLAKNETYFTADILKQAIEDVDNEEVFKSGIGCVSIENPVRRTDGRMVPLDEIKKIMNIAGLKVSNCTWMEPGSLWLQPGRVYLSVSMPPILIRFIFPCTNILAQVRALSSAAINM